VAHRVDVVPGAKGPAEAAETRAATGSPSPSQP
jgi:hypothetical protein